MQYLWAILPFCIGCLLFSHACNWFTLRITKSAKFGMIEGVTEFTVAILLINLISVIAILLGVEAYNLQNVGLICPLVMATVSALVLLFLMKRHAKKSATPIDPAEVN